MPPDRISALTGLAQAGEMAGRRFGATWLPACFAVLITAGFIGQLSTYIAASTRLPFTLGIDHYMPPAFATLHPRWNTPHISILAQAALATVLLLAAQLGTLPNKLLIEGHTDAVGLDVDNLSLSDRRAQTVADVLSQQFGVPRESLVTQGYGKQFLLVPTDGPERRNRRVVVRRITPLLQGEQSRYSGGYGAPEGEAQQ